ncbi:manganese efflux pump [Dielma fastidiosa]|uniref:manganese efflux pump n=1 Tax=Dielma fastidiosa TaxID=1034346 RepID=UPI0035614536
MIEWLFLVMALSFDAFLVSITYGLDNMKVNRSASVIIAFIGTLFLFLSLSFAALIQSLLNEQLALALSAGLLMLLGCCSLFKSLWKSWLGRLKRQPMCVKFKNIILLLEIAEDEKKADVDNSNTLSVKEAIMLATALSMDSLASGFAYGLSITPSISLYLVNFIVCVLFVQLGLLIGKVMKGRLRWDLSWLSGAFLILLAFSRLL